MVPALPIELLMYIIESFEPHLDKSTLRACASVSKTWAAIARPIYFQHVIIPAESILGRVAKRVRIIQRHVHRVRTLSFVSNATGALCPIQSLNDIVSVADRFPNIKRLEFSCIQIAAERRIPIDVRRSQETVKSIDIKSVLFLSNDGELKPSIFEYLFALYPSVKHLFCRGSVRRQRNPGDTYHGISAPFETLSCSHMFGFDFWKFVGDICHHVIAVHTLDYVEGEIFFISSFLQRAIERSNLVTTLKTLRVGVDLGDSISGSSWFRIGAVDYWDRVQLNRLTNLHVINVVIKGDDFAPHTYLLRHLPGSVRTVTFEVDWAEGDDVEAHLAWLQPSHVDACVEQGVENIVFGPYYIGQVLGPSVEKAIRAYLPTLEAKGILHVMRTHRKIKGCRYLRRQ